MTNACTSHGSCRSCGTPLTHTFVDLGLSPISNHFIRPENAAQGEFFYPLHALVCDQCWLVQLRDVASADTHFHDDYAYFSSYSSSWLDHAHRYVDDMTARFDISGKSKVIEIASNDGYLLQYFVKAGVTCLGVEPTANTAAAAREKGVQTREVFFGREAATALREEGWQADLLLGNNVLAHVPDLNDFVGGMPIVLAPEGVVTMEFPHLLRLIEQTQFDTLYHEHFSYLSLLALQPVFARAGLRVFDIEHLGTHGGSLRVYLCHDKASHATLPAVAECLDAERAAGLDTLRPYQAFASAVAETKRDLLAFLIEARRAGKRVAAYGAPAKGNTLLNYCGVGTDLIDFTVDRNPHKQNTLLPGTRIPVLAPEAIDARRPDYVVILPWNLRDEIAAQLAHIRQWGGKFVVPIPRVECL